jgi:putative transposase
LSKNLYNASLYEIRQHYKETNKHLSYPEVYHKMKSGVDYKALPAKVSCQTMKKLEDNFQSFFKLVKAFNEKKIEHFPSIPFYKKEKYGKLERFLVVYPKQALGFKSFKKEGKIQLSKTDIKLTTKLTDWSCIKEVRIVPRKKYYIIEIIYFKLEKELKPDNGSYASIDVGINNLMTVAFNDKAIQPLIVNGRPLKSFNQYFNKKLASIKSELEVKNKVKTSKRISLLNLKRTNKINDYLHKVTTELANQIELQGVCKVIYGRNKNWKQDVNIGGRNNQNFVSIPMDRMRSMLVYKLLLRGIEMVEREEAYTSKCSFLDLEPIKKHEVYAGYRKSRGMFKSRAKGLINADLNGAYNIMRKAIPEVFADGTEGYGVSPVVLKVKR